MNSKVLLLTNFDSEKNMAHHKSALKRIRQTRSRKLYNRQNKKQIKEAIKEVFACETYEAGFEKYKVATGLLDRLSLRGILHKNTAGNRKASMAKFLNSLKNGK